MYYTYMLRCADNSIYSGITTDLEKRMSEHFSQDEKCAKYTKSHVAKKLERVWKSENRVDASKLEYRLKHISKQQKEKLIIDPELFKELFDNKLEIDKYALHK